MCFYYFSIISPWGRTFPLIWTNLNPHQPRMLCAKFNWYWSCGSREKDFKKLLMCFRYFAIIVSPMGRAWLFIGTTWITWIPLYSKVLCAKKKIKKWKVYRQTDWQTDGQIDRQTKEDRWSEKAHLSFQLWWAKKARGHGPHLSYEQQCLMIKKFELIYELCNIN